RSTSRASSTSPTGPMPSQAAARRPSRPSVTPSRRPPATGGRARAEAQAAAAPAEASPAPEAEALGRAAADGRAAAAARVAAGRAAADGPAAGAARAAVAATGEPVSPLPLLLLRLPRASTAA